MRCLLAFALTASVAAVAFDAGEMSLNLTMSQTVSSLTIAAPDLASGRFEMAFARGSFALGDVSLRARLVSAGAAAPFDTLTTARAPHTTRVTTRRPTRRHHRRHGARHGSLDSHVDRILLLESPG